MILPPHIVEMLDAFRGRRDVPKSPFKTFEALKMMHESLPLDERCDRWETAMIQLRRYIR
jgi:hypothetical protein